MRFNDEITIAGSDISKSSRVFIIAEAGVNHGGDIETAKRLVDAAAQSGADAVKFQLFKTEELILGSVEKAAYQKKSTGAEESQFEMLKGLEMDVGKFLEIKRYCYTKGIIFLITPFDEVSLDELDKFELSAYKVASTDLTNLPFLKKVAKKNRPILLSTGMSYLSEVEMALREIHPYNRDVLLLHCSANYPVADSEVNLAVLATLKRRFNVMVGYSDHTSGVGAAPFAVALGAMVIEKHLTLDNDMDGPDHKASLCPCDFKSLVQEVRRVEVLMGDPVKQPTPSEAGTRAALQKCLVAKVDMPIGTELTEDNIVAKRTGGKGISPVEYKQVVGRRAIRGFVKDELIVI